MAGNGNKLMPEEELVEADVLGSVLVISVAALAIHLMVQSRRSMEEKGMNMFKL